MAERLDDLDDGELACRAAVDEDAFEVLYWRHARVLAAFVARHHRVADQMSEVVAATWLEVVRSLPRYRPERACFRSWLFGIAANVSAGAAREGVRRRELLDRLRERTPGLPVAEQPPGVGSQVTDVALAEALESLSGKQRAALVLTSEGFSPEEIADVLGVPSVTVRMRLYRARARMRSALGERHGADVEGFAATERWETP